MTMTSVKKRVMITLTRTDGSPAIMDANRINMINEDNGLTEVGYDNRNVTVAETSREIVERIGRCL